jgi:hypothetical protein
VHGIELLNANARLEGGDNGNLVVVNEAAGMRKELPLTVREGPAEYRTKRKRGTT